MLLLQPELHECVYDPLTFYISLQITLTNPAKLFHSNTNDGDGIMQFVK